MPIEETKTEGFLILDGSYGYIVKVKSPIKIIFKQGRIQSIEETASGKILSDYIKMYNDEEMYAASEFGVGLNSLSKCE